MDLTAVGLLNIGIALLVIGLCIPLILRKVPMNQAYGFRTKEAFESEKNWYDINAAGGKTLLLATIPLLIAGIIQALAPEGAPGSLEHLTLAVICMPLACLIQCRRRRRGKKDC